MLSAHTYISARGLALTGAQAVATAHGADTCMVSMQPASEQQPSRHAALLLQFKCSKLGDPGLRRLA
jgi:hypothetical protein